jgi:aspartyl-tRNA(Asn)/glutamyl-tRNA(Gln) amidotransferase subunit A
MDTRGEGFGAEVRRRVLLGTYVLSAGYYDAYYNKAVLVRRKLTDEFKAVFADVDLIATPTSPSPAFKIGEKTSDPLKMYLEDIFTVSANITGVPGVSIPNGTVSRDGKDLPVGIQFMANHFHEDYLFGIGKAAEKLNK